MASSEEYPWNEDQGESLPPLVIYLPDTTDPYDISLMEELVDNLTATTAVTTVSPPIQRPTNRALNARLTTLWLLFVSGVIGNTCALIWLWHRRHRKSRVLKIIFGLVTADLCVCFFVILFSVVYEMMGYRWLLGNISCKLMMFMQTTAIMASSYMLVLLALDRHMAVRSPMKGSYPTARLVVLVWIIAAALSIPQLRVWKLHQLEFNVCKTIFGKQNDPRKLVYILYATITSFCVPFIITSVAYVRICKKIMDKARETRVDQAKNATSFKLVDEKGKVRLQRSGARTLQQAKGKTLKMSITIIAMFLLCGFPYFLVGIIGNFTKVNRTLNAIFGIFAVSNSSINPYIFLWFSQKKVVTERYSHCKRKCCRCFDRRKIDEPVDSLKVAHREKIIRASSGGLTQDSSTGSSSSGYRSPPSKVTLTLTLSAQNYV